MSSTTEAITNEEIRELLRHPDGMVRSLADWAREYRGNGWRAQITPNEGVAEDFEHRLRERLAQLEALG